ncbi:hypothetical protein FAY30_12460 [Bacillus sp. S3]|uniref:hypothetical protein n=1 Tax=Bacillus sp. S3 TaxID=486398 RepID=UPI00118AFF6D|nr:hypothetical protein [Bacillus sp. S3]QCJ42655.1 hypothetical protein FAY30_12460 [Bacillus sp. S3]
MQIEFGNTTIHISLLIHVIFFAVILYFLWKWSKELENRSFTIFLYFLISTHISPLYSHYTLDDGKFELWFPLGFVVILIYLYVRKRNHPAKMKASLLGLAVAIYKIIGVYLDM